MKLIALPQPNNKKANSTQFGNLMKQTEGHCLCEMRNTSVCFRVLEFNTCPTHMTEWPAARAIKEKPWMADSGHQSESIVFLEKLDLNPSTFPHSIKSGNISEIWLKIWHFVISLMFGFRKRKFFIHILHSSKYVTTHTSLSIIANHTTLRNRRSPLQPCCISSRSLFCILLKKLSTLRMQFCSTSIINFWFLPKMTMTLQLYLGFWKDTRFFKFWKISDKNIC